MLSGHLQGRILKMVCRLFRPKRILEIGTYTAYATLCMAEGIDDDALIYTIEINDEMEDFIMNYIPRSPYREKIKLFFGDAMQLIPTLGETFDMVFIDADKRLYSAYYDLVFPLVRQGGIILADNVFWDGKVFETPPPGDKQTAGILEFNEKIRHDARIEKVILPLRDGLTVIWKK
jgi:predicted O-methyltransferase YrrM